MKTQEYLELCYKAGLSEGQIDDLLASWVASRHVLEPDDAPTVAPNTPSAAQGSLPRSDEVFPKPPVTPIQEPPQRLDPVLAVAIEEHDFSLSSSYRWPDACIYCGDFYTDQDHLLPRGWTGESQRKVTPTVPSCSQCNNILGAHFIPRIHERAAQVAHRLRIKYRKELSIKRWTKNEIADMSYTLQMKIEHAEAVRDILRQRVVVLDCGGLPYFSGTPLAHQ